MIMGNHNDKYETRTEHRICSYHKKYPGRNWAGCTCSSLIETKRVELGISPDDWIIDKISEGADFIFGDVGAKKGGKK